MYVQAEVKSTRIGQPPHAIINWNRARQADPARYPANHTILKSPAVPCPCYFSDIQSRTVAAGMESIVMRTKE